MAEEIMTSTQRSVTALRKLARGNVFITFGGITNLKSLVSKVFVGRMPECFFICALGGTFPPSRSYVYSQLNQFHLRVLRAQYAKFRKSFQQIWPIVFHSENAILNRLNSRLYLHLADGEIEIIAMTYFGSCDKLAPVHCRMKANERISAIIMHSVAICCEKVSLDEIA